jgi:ATP-dependent exoDNAse (exonuclease V) alpha subunit
LVRERFIVYQLHYFQSDCDSEGDSKNEPDFQSVQSHHTITAPHEHLNIVWNKPVLVTGTARCGKSFTIYSIVNRLLQNDYRVLIAAPTGFLTSVFRSNVPDEVDCETVHPVKDNVVPTINWQLSNYDIIIIDEISMIPDIIFNHILKTLSLLLFRPVVTIYGDAGEQQPFSRETGTIMQLNSLFDETNFIRTTYHFHWREQHRVEDQEYLSFLNTIRRCNRGQNC